HRAVCLPGPRRRPAPDRRRLLSRDRVIPIPIPVTTRSRPVPRPGRPPRTDFLRNERDPTESSPSARGVRANGPFARPRPHDREKPPGPGTRPKTRPRCADPGGWEWLVGGWSPSAVVIVGG